MLQNSPRRIHQILRACGAVLAAVLPAVVVIGAGCWDRVVTPNACSTSQNVTCYGDCQNGQQVICNANPSKLYTGATIYGAQSPGTTFTGDAQTEDILCHNEYACLPRLHLDYKCTTYELGRFCATDDDDHYCYDCEYQGDPVPRYLWSVKQAGQTPCPGS